MTTTRICFISLSLNHVLAALYHGSWVERYQCHASSSSKWNYWVLYAFYSFKAKIIHINHTDYQNTNFHLELWNLHQELEQVHAIHPLKSEVDWSIIWKVISLFINIHIFCDIRADLLPPQGSSGGVCKRATHKLESLLSNLWEEREKHIKTEQGSFRNCLRSHFSHW